MITVPLCDKRDQLFLGSQHPTTFSGCSKNTDAVLVKEDSRSNVPVC